MIQKLNFHFKTSKYPRVDTNMRKTGIRQIFVEIPENSRIIGQTDDYNSVILVWNKEFYLCPVNNTDFSIDIEEIPENIFVEKYYTKIFKNSEKSVKISTNKKYQRAEIFTKKIGDLNIDKKLKIPFNSNTEYGDFCSSLGGEQRGKHRVFMGGAGGGKTTLTMYQLAKLMECNPNESFKFISAEMDETELSEYADKLPILKNLETLCLPTYASMTDDNGEFIKWDYWQLIVDFLQEGHDLVLVDSLATLGEFIIPQLEITANKFVEKYLSLCNKHRNGVNKSNKFTTFWTIQQVTKGGDFVGSNALKHNTQSMFEIFKEDKTGRRFIKSTKNRTGSVHGIEKMYFVIKDKELVFDIEQLKMDIEAKEIANTISENSLENQQNLSDLLIQNKETFDLESLFEKIDSEI